MNHPVRNFVLLAILCGVLVSGAHVVTRDRIEANRQQFSLKQLRELAGNPEEHLIKLKEGLFAMEKDGGLTGYLVAGETREGYNGLIRAWVALTPDARIRGMRVIEHQETPGIGDAIDIHVSPWIRQFGKASNHEPGDLALKRDGGGIDQITGATITSRAMLKLANSAVQSSRRHIAAWRLKAEKALPASSAPAGSDR